MAGDRLCESADQVADHQRPDRPVYRSPDDHHQQPESVGPDVDQRCLGDPQIAICRSDLGIAKTTLIDVGSYAFGLLVMIVWASIDRSIWSLVMGNIVGVAAKTIASHVWLDGIKNRFAWESKSLRSLRTFG